MGFIAIAWLAYLLPWILKNRGHTVEAAADAVDRFADSMVIVRRGDQDAVSEEVAATEVSTPLLRNAAREDIAIQAHTAVRRRRIGLIINMIVLVACAVAPIFLTLPWWVAGIGPVMLVCWVVVSHASVGVINRRLDRGLEMLARGWDEQTAVLGAASQTAVSREIDREAREHSIDLSKPIDLGTSLPDPLPVTPMTYVNKPPRSVRPIDLSAPTVRPTAPAFPVTDTYAQDALPFAVPPVEVQTEETTSHAIGE